ncbi:response regulator transcription factor [Mesorhizobium sp. CAU 1732]|uniref:response regulator transcription factor n=1 Tax=Mesorhizobium sp. CAU 1732 TaxID=3140358 RepID=UPI003260C92D
MEHRIRIAVVDDHPLFRDGVVHTLSMNDGFEVVGEGASAADAIRLARDLQPHVMLLDMKLPGGGLEAVDEIMLGASHPNILMLTVVDEEESVANAFRSGVRGYLLKGVGRNELVETVKSVAQGDLYVSPQLAAKMLGRLSAPSVALDGHANEAIELTEREEQVLKLLSHGLSNKEIAYRLQLSEKTVKYYLTHVLKKLRLRNRVEAALFASSRIPFAVNGSRLTPA